MMVVKLRAALAAISLVGSVFVSASAWGHVAFSAPTAGENLEPGSTYPLVWVDTIPHNTEHYELYFKPGPNVEPEVIELDVDSMTHTYDWSVPTEPCGNCSLRVLQVNIDYTDYDATVPITVGDAAPPEASIDGVQDSTQTAEPVAAGAEGCQLRSKTGTANGGFSLVALGLLVFTRRRVTRCWAKRSSSTRARMRRQFAQS